jgi:hypothetical protein
MLPARPRSAAAGPACAARSLGALVLVLAAGTDAAADGELGPMLGGAVIGGHGPEQGSDLVGGSLEAAWWRGRLGLAPESTMLWNLGGDGARATTLGISARLRVHEQMLPSLLEPRDVELGLELHAIAERTWWSGDGRQDSPTGYGVGVAVRLRGGSDDFSTVLTESRLFVRAMSSQRAAGDAAARAMVPAEERASELTILVGIGAAFGTGEPRYLDRFRLHPLELPSGPGGYGRSTR